MRLETTQKAIDYRDAFRAYAATMRAKAAQASKNAPSDKKTIRLLVILAMAVYLAWLMIEGYRSEGGILDLQIFAFLGVVAGLFISVWALNAAAGQIAHDHATRHPEQPIALETSEEGIRVESPVAHTLYRWNFFSQMTETPKTFVLIGKRVTTAELVLAIPKELMTLKQQEELRSLLLANVLPEAKIACNV